MGYDIKLADKVRECLAEKAPDSEITEKEMFNMLNFMVNDKTCMCVGSDKLMLRFDPKLQEELAKKDGYETMLMKGKEYKGYCYMHPDGFKTVKDLEYLVDVCLEYNKIAKASKKKAKTSPK